MRRLQLGGRTVVLTGAARGLGRQLALRLALEEGSDLVLIDRDEIGLQALTREIASRSAVSVRPLVRDLLDGDSALQIFQQLREVEVFGLINNAGLTHYGPTAGASLPRYRSIIDLDFRLVVELCLLFLPKLQASGRGFICNVTSLGSFVPIPYQSVYAAAKAAAQSFSECLYLENRNGPVQICTVAPSGIVTEMIREAGLTRHMSTHRYSYLSAESAAGEVIRGLKRGKRLIIPGGINRLIYRLIEFLPRALLLRLAAAIYNYERYGEER